MEGSNREKGHGGGIEGMKEGRKDRRGESVGKGKNSINFFHNKSYWESE